MNFEIIAKALVLTLVDQIDQVGSIIAKPVVGNLVKAKWGGKAPSSRWKSSSILTKLAVDGAVLEGLVPAQAYAKYAIPKGLPLEEGKKSLVIENPPHELSDFDGKIEQGYGKGTKKLLISQRVPVKVEGNTPYLGKINYHVHEADRAGLHYDLVVEGVQPGTSQFELNIPSGAWKGRYAFITTERGMLATRMKDRGVTLNKPVYKLRPEEFLGNVTSAIRSSKKGSEPFTVEWKPDGSLGNVSIEDWRVVIRSHRPEADTYYDKLPGLEFLALPKAKFLISNWLLQPEAHNLVGTVLQGELFHERGVGFVSGVLNSLPERAQIAQKQHGPVKFYIWDISKYRGKDVTGLPYRERRALCDDVASRLQRFNRNYNVVDRMSDRGDAVEFYRKIVNDPRGLPWSEGVVIKDNFAVSGTVWEKVKAHDWTDAKITDFMEGDGKYQGNLGKIVVETMDGLKSGKVGTGFTDLQRRWIWDNRQDLIGAVVKIKVMEETGTSLRAPRFHDFHESKGSNDIGLQMYAYELALGDAKESKRILYSLKTKAGWKPK